MTSRFALLASLALMGQAAPPPAAAPQAVPAPVATPVPAATPQPALVMVRLVTSAGPIVLALEKERAPITTANFLRYVDAKRFDGISFYRAMTTEWGGGLIQAGVRDTAKLFPPIRHEPTDKTGVKHVEGAISMARNAPGSATADWSIMVGDMSGLDAKPGEPGFAAFGHVVEGMDVVRKILASPTSRTMGVGIMKGQMLQPPVRIVSARRI
ncbi:peptidyl-prolyl cis-trans isomerase A (cyclophilin A) [Sphingomonas guangdongensis]|uniref:peptidylprolyl isomerase n=1 Tax=Sphingomonas guangdongensis TaxID=1141890 RepID=A0A285QG18_9SPHN|nr:peptidylprolyl isomerase [Sphingomonas guangdongensis]SOB80776.1 peptidyl-prolyl cis-trans isomerase A (cyclophilin A) [Sphingomonas guangdongensis]